jgi:hypothetical protein
MNFKNRPDAVAITSADAARAEANATGETVTVRDPVTDKVLATVRPASKH